MGLTETAILYLLIGVVVAVAMRARQGGGRVGVVSWTVFWPFYAPELWAPTPPAQEPPAAEAEPVQRARHRLRTALGSLDGAAEHVIRPQLQRIEQTLSTLAAADRRLADMEELLASPELDAGRVQRAIEELQRAGHGPEEPRVQSLRAQGGNIERLRRMRDRTRDELERALLRIEEIASRVILLRFAEQPERELARLLEEVASSVRSVAEAVEASAL